MFSFLDKKVLHYIVVSIVVAVLGWYVQVWLFDDGNQR